MTGHAIAYVPGLRQLFVMGGMTTASDYTALMWAFNVDTKQWQGVAASTFCVTAAHNAQRRLCPKRCMGDCGLAGNAPTGFVSHTMVYDSVGDRYGRVWRPSALRENSERAAWGERVLDPCAA